MHHSLNGAFCNLRCVGNAADQRGSRGVKYFHKCAILLYDMNINEISEKATPVLRAYPIKYAGVFGSFARGEENEKSDIDILIDYGRPFSLLDLVGLQNRLKDILKRDVDVVTERGVSKYMKPAIMRDLTVFYGKR